MSLKTIYTNKNLSVWGSMYSRMVKEEADLSDTRSKPIPANMVDGWRPEKRTESNAFRLTKA